MAHLLIVEDDELLRDALGAQLTQAGHRITTAADGAEALERLALQGFDGVVFDLGLPLVDGLTVLRRLRQRLPALPVLILTARDGVEDRVEGLNAGADDYLTKPFSPRELYLRISAILRRVNKVTHVSELQRGRFLLDRKNMKLFLDGAPLDLTTTEFKLLTTLMENDTTVHTRADLLREVWGYNSDVATRTLDTHIKRLREKLGAAGAHIVTIRGTGFQFQTEAAAPTSA
ncbi:response regulator transcription factor [Prosthecobacter sp.]|uniref:response regulator transcription factor n=1 Tax=Prosthecobacter sp. TaxID=1965333 RepID=UPI002AB85CCF|nr:response regulator transcription factor [Prosthecobacter sp.]MDZ4402709.1 response regulator transcription factor [Prosthecobacter sp.]